MCRITLNLQQGTADTTAALVAVCRPGLRAERLKAAKLKRRRLREAAETSPYGCMEQDVMTMTDDAQASH